MSVANDSDKGEMMSTTFVHYSNRFGWRLLALLVLVVWQPALPVQASRPPPLSAMLAGEPSKAAVVPAGLTAAAWQRMLSHIEADSTALALPTESGPDATPVSSASVLTIPPGQI